jgi:hypothetical protein
MEVLVVQGLGGRGDRGRWRAVVLLLVQDGVNPCPGATRSRRTEGPGPLSSARSGTLSSFNPMIVTADGDDEDG